MKFTELPLHPDLQKSIEDAGFTECTPVQAEAFEVSFAKRDLYVQSQTGTGKTAAFVISIYQRLLSDPAIKGKKALVVVPTRELAVQVEEEARKLGKHLPFRTAAFYGGVAYGPQETALRDGVDLMIGTPGRMLDFQKQGKMLLKDVAFLVIDEADRMFDMGFYPDLREMLRFLPPSSERQTMLFSATLNVRVKNLAWEYMENAAEIVIEPDHVTVEEITQELFHVGSDEKLSLTVGLIKRLDPPSAIIFCNTKRQVEEVAKRLRMNGIECEFIMGDLPQKQRLDIIDGMKTGKHTYLVATDVAARGLDIQDLGLVINYDLPTEPENYVHRIGRTARAGKSGKAVSFACEKFVYGLSAIEKYIGFKIPAGLVDEDLFPVDKSKGTRVHFDRYDEDRPGRDDRRGGRGGEGRGGQRRDGGQRREGGHGQGGRDHGGNRGPRDRSASNRLDAVDRRRHEGSRNLQSEISAVAGGVIDPRGLPSDAQPFEGQPREGQRREGGQRQGQRRDGGQRPGQQRRGEGGQREGGQRGQGQRSGGGQRRGGQEARDAAPVPGNPYEVPMEKRLAQYRQKYGGNAGGAQEGQREGEGKRAPDGQRREGRPQGGQRQGDGRRGPRGQGQGRPQGGAQGKPASQHKQHYRGQEKPAQAAPAPEQKKGGILGKISGIFKKKKPE